MYQSTLNTQKMSNKHTRQHKGVKELTKNTGVCRRLLQSAQMIGRAGWIVRDHSHVTLALLEDAQHLQQAHLGLDEQRLPQVDVLY